MCTFTNILKISFFCITFFGSQIVVASQDDEYLKQLEMEVDQEVFDGPSVLNTDESEDVLNEPTLDAPSTDYELILDKKELIVDKKSFAKALKASFPESFELYEQLTEEQRNSIYQGFTKEKRLYNASVKIISIYLGSH